MAFSLGQVRRYERTRKGPNSTCLDPAMDILILNEADSTRSKSWFCKSVRRDLGHIQAFLKFAQNESDRPENLVRSIEDAFELTDLDIGDAVRKGDDQFWRALVEKLLRKVVLFRARIHEAYGNSYSFEGTFKPSRIRYIRIEKNDVYSTCLDYAVDTITQRYGLSDAIEWIKVEMGLHLIQGFLISVSIWSDADNLPGGHLGDVVRCIEDAFKTVEVDIENAVNKGDAEGLYALSLNLLEKIEILKPKIAEAYVFLCEDKLPHNIKPFVLITDPNLWGRICDLLIKNGYSIFTWGGSKVLGKEFPEIASVIQYFGGAYIEYVSKRDDGSRLWGLGSLMHGGAIHLARVMYLFEVKKMNEKDAIIAISDLRQRIRLVFPEILDMYKQPPRDVKHVVKQLVDMISPPLQTLRDGVHPLIEYLLEPCSKQQHEDDKQLRLDIEKVVSIDILAANDDDQLFLQKIECLKEEVLLRRLIARSDSLSAGAVFESINMGLSSVQTFVNQRILSEKSVVILKNMEQMARDVTSQVGTSRQCDAVKLKLSIEFKIMKIQVFLMEQCSPGLMVPLEDQIFTFSEGLQLLFKYFSSLPDENQSYKELIFTCFERVAKEEPPPYYFPRSNQSHQHFIDQMSVFLSSLLQQVNHINSDIQDTVRKCRRSLRLTLPKTHQGLGFLDSFFEKLRGLIMHGADLVGDSMKHQIEAVIKELESFKSFLLAKRVGEKPYHDLELHTQIITATQEAEYIIDWILLGQWDCKHVFWLSIVINEMKELNEKLANFVHIENDFDEVNVSQQQSIATQANSALEVGEAVVSLEDQEEIIIDQLITRGTSQKRNVVTISGMPGIGKTTLAKKVYDHPRVKTHFHKLAWCCVSQVYRKRDLLIEILSDINKSSNEDVDKKSNDDLLDMLYKSLKGIRYCVVMDDVWSNRVWEELGIAFPDDKNGSRIVITARNQEVGLKANSVPHTLRSLTKEESWKLLRQKVFHEDVCPPELGEVGLMIAEGCKGLPLSIFAIAGILKPANNDVERWKQIERDLNSRIFNNAEIQCMHILELSYNHLPGDLKPCFLYFAAFGEDGEVPVKKLIRFWIAEGFISDVRDQNTLLEDMAEIYVMNLIARSLLMIVKKGSDGRVKACRVHDMLYKVCLRKVEEDNFLQYVNGYDKLFPSADWQLDYGVDSEYSPITLCRLSLCSKRMHFAMLKPSGTFVRTLLFNATSDSFPRCPYDDVGTFITENFKILNILDIESINLGSSFPKRIELLYPLRYLGISGDIRSVPSTVAKLWNLETLVVKGLMGKVTLPDTLWSMSKLRHLHVTTQAIFSLPDMKDGESTPELRNMVSLSCPALSRGDHSEEVMKLFPKLRKLRCTFSEPAQHSEKSIRFPTLDFLVELESLKIIYYGHLHQYCQLKGVRLPLNLKKLSLSDFSFTWGDFSTIGKLPNLNILKLVSIAFDSPIWEMADDEFRQLEYLKLDSLKITEWNVESDPVPNIKQLVLRNCIRLNEVPVSFGDIATLEVIELKWCSDSVEASVMTILKQKLEYGDEGFKAFINGFVADPKFSMDD